MFSTPVRLVNKAGRVAWARTPVDVNDLLARGYKVEENTPAPRTAPKIEIPPAASDPESEEEDHEVDLEDTAEFNFPWNE